MLMSAVTHFDKIICPHGLREFGVRALHLDIVEYCLDNKYLREKEKDIKKLGAKLDKKVWIIIVE